MGAIEKIKAEMEQHKGDQFVQVVGDYLLQHLKDNPQDADKVMAEGKNVKGSLSEMEKEARKKKVGSVAVLTPQEGFSIVLRYYGITGKKAGPAPEKKEGFDVSLEDFI